MEDFKTFLGTRITEGDDSNNEEKTREVIISLANNDFESLKDQMKGVQLLKGIAAADNDLANEFMRALSDAYTSIAEKIGVIEPEEEPDEEPDEEPGEEESDEEPGEEESDEEDDEEGEE